MGRLTKSKTDEIRKLREQGYTQKETAEKAGVHLRTVRKYDPSREKPVGPTAEQVDEIERACDELVAKGLLHRENDGWLWITSLGKRVLVRLRQLRKKAVFEFMAEAHRPVSAGEIGTYLDEMDDELLDQALDDVKRP
jgi:transcriptional regulator with XRE-family HTH domain